MPGHPLDTGNTVVRRAAAFLVPLAGLAIVLLGILAPGMTTGVRIFFVALGVAAIGVGSYVFAALSKIRAKEKGQSS